MKGVQSEVIAMLDRIDHATAFPVEFQSNASPREIRLASDLIDQGYLDGGHAEDESGVPIAVAVTGITLSGRQFLEDLMEQRFKRSASGKLVACLKYLGVFVLGIIGTLFTQWAAKRMGLN